LEGIEETAEETLMLVKRINAVVERTAEDIKATIPKIYSKELVDLLFFEFYTKISYVEKGLGVTRKTASGYLTALEEHGILASQKIGKEKVYLNKKLFTIVKESGSGIISDS
jgi:hypothetical protein